MDRCLSIDWSTCLNMYDIAIILDLVATDFDISLIRLH